MSELIESDIGGANFKNDDLFSRKSQYYVCMYSITVANIILLGTICVSVLLDTYPTAGSELNQFSM